MVTGAFNPLGAIAFYLIGRLTFKEMAFSLAAQIFAMLGAVFTYSPVMAFIGRE
jgi:hypothetical protein